MAVAKAISSICFLRLNISLVYMIFVGFARGGLTFCSKCDIIEA
jgi:hypothetical protein